MGKLYNEKRNEIGRNSQFFIFKSCMSAISSHRRIEYQQFRIQKIDNTIECATFSATSISENKQNRERQQQKSAIDPTPSVFLTAF